jgi:flagellar basal body-associated protein FliL
MNEKSKKILKVVLILAIVIALVAILVVQGRAGIV